MSAQPAPTPRSALRQVASLTTVARISTPGLRGRPHADLPRDIRVLDAREAPLASTHGARRPASANASLIDNGPVAIPLLDRYAWHIPQRLDVTRCGGRWRGSEAATTSRVLRRAGREKDPSASCGRLT